MANNNQIYKMSNAGGFKSLTRYYDMLAGNTTWNPWEPQGAFDALATVTVPSGGVASVTFAGIPTGYKHLQIRGIARTNRAVDIGYIKYNYNNVTASGNYKGHNLVGDGSTAYGDYWGETNQGMMLAPGNNNSTRFTSFVFDILDYSSTSKNKTTRILSGFDMNGSGFLTFMSNLFLSTDAITTISFGDSSGANISEFSQFALYGVK